MPHQVRPLINLFRVVGLLNIKIRAIPRTQFYYSPHLSPLSSPCDLATFRGFHFECGPKLNKLDGEILRQPTPVNETVLMVQNLLRDFSKSSKEEREEALDNCELSITEDFVLDLLRRNHSNYDSAFQFLNWVSSVTDLSGYVPSVEVYNEMLGILGKARQFEKLEQVFDEMFKRRVMNERTFDIVLHRYAAAHKIGDAVEFYYKRKQYGFELDLGAFQSLLMSLCRYKHVETAETLFQSKKGEFRYDTKTWNIILNGWCVLRNLHETKRFWNELIHSECKLDKFSYGTYINSLCKFGKVSSALKLFRSMWEDDCTPDVVICNSVIDGLCFKKRVPEALEVFREMNSRGCQPNVGTYNCLIKYMCKIRRMENATKLLTEMEDKGGDCTPNDMTYIYFLTVAKKPEEVVSLLERMKRQGCKITGDVYNLVLRLYMNWECDEHVQMIWDNMSRDGTGPDHRSYTIMIHKLCEQGKVEDALDYFREMMSKKMILEPRTLLLADAMKSKLKEEGSEKVTDV